MKKSTPLMPLFFLLFAVSTNAQMVGMNMSLFQAKGDLNNNIDRNPAGVSFTYTHDLNEQSPWSIGAELGVAMYSNKEYQTLDLSDEPITIYEEDCFWNMHFFGQYKVYETPMFALYGEARTGLTTFFSEKHAVDSEAELNEFKVHGTAFNLGIGGGVQVNLSGLFRGDGASHRNIWLDASMTANSGTRTNYRHATEDTKLLNDASYRSLTNYDHTRVGIAYRFRN